MPSVTLAPPWLGSIGIERLAASLVASSASGRERRECKCTQRERKLKLLCRYGVFMTTPWVECVAPDRAMREKFAGGKFAVGLIFLSAEVHFLRFAKSPA